MASIMKWLPLESNPEVINKFIYNLGVPKSFAMVDVLGLEEELQAGLPQPIVAVFLLFPTGEKHEAFCKQQQEDIETNGQPDSSHIYFMQQTIKNACGTVALIHAIANAGITLEDGSALHQFLESTKELSALERGQELEKSDSISAAHESSAQEGQTEAPPADSDVDLHFVAFVNVNGTLYELDGRKQLPIDHGLSAEDTLLKDASAVCKQFMERDPDNVNFNVMALAAAEDA